jgi:hypothetical protein
MLQLNPQQEVLTKQSYASGIEITVIARLDEKSTLRIDGLEGAQIELSLRGLSVHRPDNPTRGQLGSAAGSHAAALTANAWQSIRWRITDKGMEIWVNPQPPKNQPVFKEPGKYAFTTKRPIRLSAADSAVDIKEFLVRPAP